MDIMLANTHTPTPNKPANNLLKESSINIEDKENINTKEKPIENPHNSEPCTVSTPLVTTPTVSTPVVSTPVVSTPVVSGSRKNRGRLVRDAMTFSIPFRDLADYDDLLCDLLLDGLFMGFRTHKMCSYSQSPTLESYSQLPAADTESYEDWFSQVQPLAKVVLKLVQENVMIKGKVPQASSVLMDLLLKKHEVEVEEEERDLLEKALSKYQKFLSSKSEQENRDFKGHMEKYLSMYHPNAGYEIARTFRYKNSNKVEACLLATKYWKKGDQMQMCVGTMTALTEEEEEMLGKRDFSLIYSTKNKHTSLFLGPARFANHDCKPNVQFMPSDNGTICFYVIEEIAIGQEICVNYGDSYFGENNDDCLCSTCEMHGRGGYFVPENFFQRKTAARTKKFNYYDDDLYNINIKILQETPENESGCKCCNLALDSTTSHKLPASAFSGKGKSGKEYDVCSRCFRHYSLFACLWPQRKPLVLKDFLNTNVTVEPIPEIPQEIEDDRVPGDPVTNGHLPYLVWVNPGTPGKCVWWPAVIVPEKYCGIEKTCKRLAASKNERTVVVLYLESPSVGTCEFDEMKMFCIESEPFFRFLRIDPDFSDSIALRNMTNLSRGILPHGAKWREFTPIFKSLINDYPHLFGQSTACFNEKPESIPTKEPTPIEPKARRPGRGRPKSLQEANKIPIEKPPKAPLENQPKLVSETAPKSLPDTTPKPIPEKSSKPLPEKSAKVLLENSPKLTLESSPKLTLELPMENPVEPVQEGAATVSMEIPAEDAPELAEKPLKESTKEAAEVGVIPEEEANVYQPSEIIDILTVNPSEQEPENTQEPLSNTAMEEEEEEEFILHILQPSPPKFPSSKFSSSPFQSSPGITNFKKKRWLGSSCYSSPITVDFKNKKSKQDPEDWVPASEPPDVIMNDYDDGMLMLQPKSATKPVAYKKRLSARSITEQQDN